MLKKVLIGAVALALSANAAHAGGNKFTKEEGTGMFTGAAAGAIVGGPVGAFVGLMIGGIVGDSVGNANRADQRAQVLEDELLETRVALSKASEQASEKASEDQILAALAERLHADVMFRTGSADLDDQVAAKLGEIGKLLATHQTLEVQLHGFADPRGKSEENLKLSALRADAVRSALINGGADPTQIALSAHGEDLTTAAKDDVEAYAWERRVSLSIRPIDDASVAQSR